MTWSTETVQLKQFTVVLFFFFEAAVRREINATQCDTGLSLIFQSGNNGGHKYVRDPQSQKHTKMIQKSCVGSFVVMT